MDATTKAPKIALRREHEGHMATSEPVKAHQNQPDAKPVQLRSVNPFNGQTLKTYPEMAAEQVDAAIGTAHERFATGVVCHSHSVRPCYVEPQGCAATASKSWPDS